jgi:hypothetical protein
MKAAEFEYLIESNPEVARIELESQGLVLRVVSTNGEPHILTQEINSNRVNVSVVDNVISSIEGIY